MREDIKKRIEKIQSGVTPDGYNKTKWGVLPKQWKKYKIKDIFSKVGKPVAVEPDKKYVQIGIRSHGKGLFYKEPVTGKELGNKTVFWIEPYCFVVNIVFAWELAIGKTTTNEIGFIGSHRFPMYRPLENKADLDYILQFFMTKRGKNILEEASPGGAGRNKTLGQDRFSKSMIILPSFSEQQKIAKILNHCDMSIELKQQLIEEERNHKKWLMQNLLTGKRRLHGFTDKWKSFELGEIFDYIQPTPYLVKSTDYRDEYEIPVLTAGKTFILGFTNENKGVYSDLPVVIFDDFTTASKFVDFPFKAKSSAMKILKINRGFDTKFAYEALQQIRYVIGGHERHWISKFSVLTIKVPCLEEQIAIADMLSVADHKINLFEQELVQWQLKKKALMQLLLTGLVRVTV